MAVYRAFAGLLGFTLLCGAAAAVSAAEYDNPTVNNAPCVVLNTFATEADDGAYRASVEVENICARSVEVALCFGLVPALGEDGVPGEPSEACFGSIVRPGEVAGVDDFAAQQRVIGADYQWRWAPY